MAEDGKGGAIDETTGKLRERFSTPEEEEALALETLGTARVAGLGPQVTLRSGMFSRRCFRQPVLGLCSWVAYLVG